MTPAAVAETTESVRLQNALKGLCEQYHLIAVYVFGSRAPEIAARVHGEPGKGGPYGIYHL